MGERLSMRDSVNERPTQSGLPATGKRGREDGDQQGGPTCSSSQTPPGQTSAQIRVNELYVPMLFMKENFADVSFPIHIKLQVLVRMQHSAVASRESIHTGIIRKYEHYGNRTFHYLLTSIQPTLKIQGSSKPKPVEWSKLEDGTVRVSLEMPVSDSTLAGATSTATSDVSLGTAAAAANFAAGTASSLAVGSGLSPTGMVGLVGTSSGHLLPGLTVGLAGPSSTGEQLRMMGSTQDMATTLGQTMPGMLTSSMFGLPTSMGRNALDTADMEDSTQPMRQQAAASLDQLLEMIHPIGGAGASVLMGRAPSPHAGHSGGSSGHHLTRMSHDEDSQQLPTATSVDALVSVPGASTPLIPLLGEMLGMGGIPAVLSAEQLQQQMVDLVKKYRTLQAELVSTRNNLLAAETNLSHVQQELQKCRQELEATRTQHAQQQTLRRQLASTTASSAHTFMNTLTQLLALQ